MENEVTSTQQSKPDELSTVIAFHAGTDWSSQMHLDLNSHLVMHPSATFFLRVHGDSPNQLAIRHDDILIVDRAAAPGADSMVVAVIDGNLVITPYRALARHSKQTDTTARTVNPLANTDSAVWGVVTYVIHKI